MAVFWETGAEISDKAGELIGKYHPTIATASFAFLFKDKASPSEIEAGQVGVTKRVSGMWHTLTSGKDFVVVLTYDLWNGLSPIEQEAMLDSALESCAVKLDKDGNEKLNDDGTPEWAIKPFDIIGHSTIIKRYGLNIFTQIGDCVKTTAQAVAEPDESEYDDGEVTNEQSVPDARGKRTRKAKAGS